MNPLLGRLCPYPFERIGVLTAGQEAPADLGHSPLSLGEPSHEPPTFSGETLSASRAGSRRYPPSRGLPELREAIAGWRHRRIRSFCETCG